MRAVVWESGVAGSLLDYRTTRASVQAANKCYWTVGGVRPPPGTVSLLTRGRWLGNPPNGDISAWSGRDW